LSIGFQPVLIVASRGERHCHTRRDDCGMCRLCEGFSLEDTLALDAAAIDRYGHIVIGVADPDETSDSIPWSYTVGLCDAADHPELIVAGPSIEAAGELLNRIAKRILAGAHFAPGDRVKIDRTWARIGAVDPIQHELGTFSFWYNLRAYGAITAPEMRVLQLFAPRSWFCTCHQDSQPDLSDPLTRLDPRVG
jgi:hypothetical protein